MKKTRVYEPPVFWIKCPKLTGAQVIQLSKLLYYSKKALRMLEDKFVDYKEWDHLPSETKQEWIDEVDWFLEVKPHQPEVIFYHRVEYMKEAGWVYGENFDSDKKTSPSIIPNYDDLDPQTKLDLEIFYSTAETYIRYVARKSHQPDEDEEDDNVKDTH